MTNHKLLVDKPYVEIGGIKWATMNIGAETETDIGLYFQWGDTAGYTAEQVGSSSTAYKKPFTIKGCILHNSTNSDNESAFTKYNGSGGDNKTVLEETDDAAVANWGGDWRMPTNLECETLGNAVNTAWTNDYQSSGIKGLVCTDKTDSSKVLFFPACGCASDGEIINFGTYGNYWTNSLLNTNASRAYEFGLSNGTASWWNSLPRLYGLTVRPVLG